MGGPCSVRVDIQGRKFLSGKLRNTANMGMERPLVLFCEYCAEHCAFHKISSISSPQVKMSPFLSAMTGTRRDQTYDASKCWNTVTLYDVRVWRNDGNITLTLTAAGLGTGQDRTGQNRL
jgi:hypothetical protein